MVKLEFRRASYSSPGEVGKRGFEDLECYQLSLDVIINTHALANVLPKEERYDLASQIKRSSKSIAANIAEGYGRYHYLDSLRHYSIARGELNETLSHLITAKILDYIDEDYFNQVYDLLRKTEITLNGFMSYIRKRKEGHQEFGDKYFHEDKASNIYQKNPTVALDE